MDNIATLPMDIDVLDAFMTNGSAAFEAVEGWECGLATLTG